MNITYPIEIVVTKVTTVDQIKTIITQLNGIISERQKIVDDWDFFKKFLSDRGYKDQTEFQVVQGMVPDPTEHKSRVITPKEDRIGILKDLEENKLSPKEIGEKWGVTRDVVYNIRSKGKLTKKRKGKKTGGSTTLDTVTVPTPVTPDHN